MMDLLKDKIIFLTGGSKGIGFECAKKYAEEGARLVIVSNDADSLSEAIKFFGANHLAIAADVSNEKEVEMAILKTINIYGKIDIIHNNAGITGPSLPLDATLVKDWQQLFDVNVKSILLTTKFGLNFLKLTEGCILNTSSLVGEIGQQNHAAYTATKGAVNALTKSMALDYAGFKIRVNAIAPAGVWTPMLRQWNMEQPNTQKMEQYLNAIHPLGYCPEADVVADACVFLVSNKARFITGHILPISGGAELGYRSVI